MGACTSAEDRLEEGVRLQNRGLYMDAVYRYADAVERDGSLMEARRRLVAAGDTALGLALHDAEQLEARGEPVAAARRYQDIDRMLARIRSAGERLDPHPTYDADRRALFDRAIAWRMALGDDARESGRWAEARRAYIDARSDFGPSRAQTEASLDAETHLLLTWSEIELDDGRPRMAYELADEAMRVRSSTSRDVLLTARDLQGMALERGTVVVAVPPVVGHGTVRDHLGPEFEIRLDESLALDHWTQPPPFVRMADHQAMRRELRGLLRGVPQTPLLVGRVLQLVGADLAAMIELIDVVEGTVAYRALADIVLVDHEGREVTRFRAEGRTAGPFHRGEFDGNPDRLELSEADAALFDGRVQAEQMARIEGMLMDELATAIAAGTYDTVLSRIP